MKAFKIKQSKWRNQADCANYRTYRLHILESAYIYCVYIVSCINSERNNNIHMLGWKFVPQSDKNKNALTKITCANSFLALCVKPLSLEETLYRLCLKIISLSEALSLGSIGVQLRSPAVVNAVMDRCLSSVDCVWISCDFSLWWWHDKSVLLINLIRSNYILSDHLVRSFWSK